MKKIFQVLLALFLLSACQTNLQKESIKMTETPKNNNTINQPALTKAPESLANNNPSGEMSQMRVLWKVNSYVLLPDTKVAEADAKTYVFKGLNKTNQMIEFDGKKCQNVEFKNETTNLADYLKEKWNINPETIKLSDQKIEVIKTSCDIQGFQEYIKLTDNRLVIFIDGVAYFLIPNVNF